MSKLHPFLSDAKPNATWTLLIVKTVDWLVNFSSLNDVSIVRSRIQRDCSDIIHTMEMNAANYAANKEFSPSVGQNIGLVCNEILI